MDHYVDDFDKLYLNHQVQIYLLVHLTRLMHGVCRTWSQSLHPVYMLLTFMGYIIERRQPASWHDSTPQCVHTIHNSVGPNFLLGIRSVGDACISHQAIPCAPWTATSVLK